MLFFQGVVVGCYLRAALHSGGSALLLPFSVTGIHVPSAPAVTLSGGRGAVPLRPRPCFDSDPAGFVSVVDIF